ncbi:calcium/sodium antiporter [Photobacterium leiognathi]|uniref:Calcium/sodium antiporter n=2 Tax=Photobacterium leiognathi TaxID=553611 RepID=A0A0D8N314_PHOLE|nr:calcium/sodium antiporter [Photobacterium leiognathi]KJF90981.1 calcium/sodium:proton antiporter [Photobacterium leiognathi]KJF99368.1 calcium/sodium:proton antiporter [Photobacterium leiognathi]MCG3884613.1 calcium/sodium antiporter [Photobacterium leiognathi]PHZ59371.1 calcium/sodium antiporter [Photobacterium leiognathi]PSV02281.1 calcium/sodium antiporter [Photobacterium leiognathi subsp. mandapamensis]
MLEAIVLLCVGLVLLVWSADRLVYGAAALARNFGVAPLVIGMTILAMGSSAPEMMVSATAALAGKTDTAVGNVLGSNIANIALILGITALLKPLSISSTIIRRELPLMLGVTVIAGLLLWDNYLGRMEGVFLAVLFVLFLLAMLKISRASKNDPLMENQEEEIPTGVSNSSALIWVFIGLGLLLYSSDMVVESAVTIAKYFGMSDLVIGLTIIAVGTSLPELAASIASIYKGEDDMAVGNIIGSNVFNILAVMGIPGLLNPSVLSPLAMSRDFYVMLALSVLLLLMALGKRRRINRVEGGILVICFIAYQAYLFLNVSA